MDGSKVKEIYLYVLAGVVVVGFFCLVAMMYFIEIPAKNVGPANQLFGALVAGFSLVLGYFFGSSKGSAEKNKLLTEK